MLLFYATRDGQSRRIAERIAAVLAAKGIAATPRDLAEAIPRPDEIAGAPLLVLVAAVRYGRHLPEARTFLSRCLEGLARVPLVFVSINLTARKPGKDTPEGNPCVRKAIARYRLRPVLSAAIAGRLDYPRYRWFDRLLIRFIMTLSAGPADPRATVEFTDWRAVDDLAAAVAALPAGGGRAA